MLIYTAVFCFVFQSLRPMTSNIFLPKTRSNLRGMAGDIYIRLKMFISTTLDVYARLLNRLLSRELVAELKTMWLLT